MTDKIKTPKVFISYSWSSPEHEEWVLKIAQNLIESGVDVLLDKWDLKEGQDTYAFMEKAVNDPEVTNVLIVSDQAYAEKANNRKGGVGAETLIISPDVYQKQEQQKFIPIIPPTDESGKVHLPTYLKSRLYIDFRNAEDDSDAWEKLLRCVYGKPMHPKPELGKKPAFLDEETQISLGTTPLFTRAISAIKSGKITASGAIDEYLTVFSENLEKFRITDYKNKELDDMVVQSIEQFLPARNEFIKLLTAVLQYSLAENIEQRLHRFFEDLIQYMYVPKNVRQWNNAEFDNFRFINHELFLYTIALLIKYEQFGAVGRFLLTPFVSEAIEHQKEGGVTSYKEFRNHLKTLMHRNERLSLNYYSLHERMLHDRCSFSGGSFNDLMQADFVLYLRAVVEGEGYYSWWPITLVTAANRYTPFEIFARAMSKIYFDKMKPILSIETVDDLKNALAGQRDNVPTWGGFDRINPYELAGIKNLCTRP